jgi:hypothetical protein
MYNMRVMLSQHVYWFLHIYSTMKTYECTVDNFNIFTFPQYILLEDIRVELLGHCTVQ